MRQFALLCFVLFAFGCTKSTYNRYVIVNNSSYPLTIVNYDTSYYLKKDTIYIGVDSIYEDIAENNGRARIVSNIFYKHSGDKISDSLKIFFGTEKVLCFYSKPQLSEPENRNLLDVKKSFKKQNCRNPQGCDYYYVITDEDFEKAMKQNIIQPEDCAFSSIP